MQRTVYKLTCAGLALMALAAAYSTFLTFQGLIETARYGVPHQLGYTVYSITWAVGFFLAMLGLAYFAPLALRRLFPEVS
ncbi:MAG: hypothetical protein AAFU55_03800 [Pseudomonadota bacterium]